MANMTLITTLQARIGQVKVIECIGSVVDTVTESMSELSMLKDMEATQQKIQEFALKVDNLESLQETMDDLIQLQEIEPNDSVEVENIVKAALNTNNLMVADAVSQTPTVLLSHLFFFSYHYQMAFKSTQMQKLAIQSKCRRIWKTFSIKNDSISFNIARTDIGNVGRLESRFNCTNFHRLFAQYVFTANKSRFFSLIRLSIHQDRNIILLLFVR
jgi:hypothetical protein